MTPYLRTDKAHLSDLSIGVCHQVFAMNRVRTAIPSLCFVLLAVWFKPPAVAGPRVEVFAGNGEVEWNGEGLAATETAVAAPTALALDNRGLVLIAESNNGRILRVKENGTLETVAGCGFSGFGGDGGKGLEAFLSKPMGMVVDASGRIWFADHQNHRIRRVNLDGTIETVVGDGAGMFGLGTFAGDGMKATSASLNFPTKLALSPDGSLFIADQMNARIRRVDPAGIVSTFVGGDRSSVLALQKPVDVEIDAEGTLFVVDAGANRIVSVTPEGKLKLVLGTPPLPSIESIYPVFSLNSPSAVAVGPEGVLYWAETGSPRVCRIAADSEMEVLVRGMPGLKRGGQRESANLVLPSDLMFLPDGSLLVADPGSHYVWRLSDLED